MLLPPVGSLSQFCFRLYTFAKVTSDTLKGISDDLPDRGAHDDHFLPGIVLAVVMAPLGCPETVNADGDQSVD